MAHDDSRRAVSVTEWARILARALKDKLSSSDGWMLLILGTGARGASAVMSYTFSSLVFFTCICKCLVPCGEGQPSAQNIQTHACRMLPLERLDTRQFSLDHLGLGKSAEDIHRSRRGEAEISKRATHILTFPSSPQEANICGFVGHHETELHLGLWAANLRIHWAVDLFQMFMKPSRLVS